MERIHVVSFTEIQRIVSSLSSAVSSGYGPSFQHTIISTTTGKVMITNSGVQIVRLSELKHPIAHYIVSAVAHHHEKTGDDSKTLLVLLDELIKRSERVVGSPSHRELVSSLAKLTQDVQFILNEIMPIMFQALDRFCLRSNICTRKNSFASMTSLIAGALGSHLLEYDALHLSTQLVKMVDSWQSVRDDVIMQSVITLLIDNHKLLLIKNPGKSLSQSCLLPGYLVSRGFCNGIQSFNPNSTIRFILLSCHIDMVGEDDQNVEIRIPGHHDSVSNLIEHKRRRTDMFLRDAKELGISIILTSLQLSTLEKTLFLQHGLAAIHTVPDEELLFLSDMLNKDIIYNINEMTIAHVGGLRACQQMIFGAHAYINLLPDASVPPSTLIISGPTDAVSHQTASLIVDSLRIVKSALMTGEISQHSSVRGASGSVESLDSSVDQTSEDSGIYVTSSSRSDGTPQLSPLSLSPSSVKQHSEHAPIDEDILNEYLYTIPVGGAFEMALHEVINQYLSTQPAGARGSTALTILKEALLAVPQLIHNNAYCIAKPRWLRTLAAAKEKLRSGRSAGINATDGTVDKSTLMHSFPNKCLLIIKVLTTWRQLLRLDHII